MYQHTVCYYLVQFQPEGWALIAADDKVDPVLGYSPTGIFELDGMPISMQTWCNGYADKILEIKRDSSLSRHIRWNRLDLPVLKNETTRIASVIQVKWNQSGAYAQYCPVNTQGRRALVGCVAVAMAQAMSVLKYPAHPVGEIAYEDDDMGFIKVDFDKEPDYDWEKIMSGAHNKSEVARLLFHCGVAVQMNYGVNSSGAYTKSVPKALKNVFSYSDEVKFYNRDSYSGDWKSLILEELQAGRPVIYSGYDPSGNYGHAFNLDGFDGSNSFYVNWGWGGKNNGYFSLDNLRDGNYDYRDNHQMVIGLKMKTIPSDLEALHRDEVKILVSNNHYVISASEGGTCFMYSLSGQLLSKISFCSGETTLPKVHAGFYIVVIQYGNKRLSYKLQINE